MKTNGDRIREMNDAELADFLIKIVPAIPCIRCDYPWKSTCRSSYSYACVKEYAATIMYDWLTERENIEEIKAEVGV